MTLTELFDGATRAMFATPQILAEIEPHNVMLVSAKTLEQLAAATLEELALVDVRDTSELVMVVRAQPEDAEMFERTGGRLLTVATVPRANIYEWLANVGCASVALSIADAAKDLDELSIIAARVGGKDSAANVVCFHVCSIARPESLALN